MDNQEADTKRISLVSAWPLNVVLLIQIIRSILRKTRQRSTAKSVLLAFSLPIFQLVLNRRIAITGRILQLAFVEEGHIAPRVRDHAGSVQHAGRQADARPTSPQHLAKQFLRQRKLIGAKQVMTHQEPAGEALFYLVQTVAGGNLHGLHGKTLTKAMEFAVQYGALRQELAKSIRFHAVSRTFGLGHCTVGTGTKTVDHRKPGKATLSHQADFNTLAIGLEIHDGKQASVDEVDRFNLVPGFVQNLVNVQTSEFELGQQQVRFIGGELKQNFVANTRDIAIAFGLCARQGWRDVEIEIANGHH